MSIRERISCMVDGAINGFPKFLPGVKINQYLPESWGDFAFAAG
jgi:hypothetical protein